MGEDRTSTCEIDSVGALCGTTEMDQVWKNNISSVGSDITFDPISLTQCSMAAKFHCNFLNMMLCKIALPATDFSDENRLLQMSRQHLWAF